MNRDERLAILKNVDSAADFGTAAEHEKWLSLVNDGDVSRRQRGEGYRDGLKGRPRNGEGYGFGFETVD